MYKSILETNTERCSTKNLFLSFQSESLKGKYDRVKSSKINVMESTFSKVAALDL